MKQTSIIFHRFILLLILCLAAAREARAQVGVATGYMALNERYKGHDGNTLSWANGLQIGPSYSLGKGHWVVDFSLLYQFVWDCGVTATAAQTVQTKYTQHAIAVPVQLRIPLYVHGAKRPVNPFVYAGPTLEYGFAAKLTRITDGKPETFNAYGENGFQNRFNCHFAAGVGMVISSLVMVKLGYSQSLVNYYHPHLWAMDQNDSIYRGYISLSATMLIPTPAPSKAKKPAKPVKPVKPAK